MKTKCVILDPYRQILGTLYWCKLSSLYNVNSFSSLESYIYNLNALLHYFCFFFAGSAKTDKPKPAVKQVKKNGGTCCRTFIFLFVTLAVVGVAVIYTNDEIREKTVQYGNKIENHLCFFKVGFFIRQHLTLWACHHVFLCSGTTDTGPNYTNPGLDGWCFGHVGVSAQNCIQQLSLYPK